MWEQHTNEQANMWESQPPHVSLHIVSCLRAWRKTGAVVDARKEEGNKNLNTYMRPKSPAVLPNKHEGQGGGGETGRRDNTWPLCDSSQRSSREKVLLRCILLCSHHWFY